MKAGVCAVGVALATQAAQAAFTANDLYLGLNKSGANDYLIDLGQASTLTGSLTVVDLTGYFDYNMFNTIFGAGNGTGVSMGVVGGKHLFPGTSDDIYVTAPLGADTSSYNHSGGMITSAMADLGNVPFPTAGNSLNDGGKNWTAYVSPTLSAGTFYGDTGINPSVAFSGGSVVEGLWQATPSQGYALLGYFTLNNPSQSDASLTFTPIAVPEPTSLALLGGGGLLLLALRRRSAGKNA